MLRTVICQVWLLAADLVEDLLKESCSSGYIPREVLGAFFGPSVFLKDILEPSLKCGIVPNCQCSLLPGRDFRVRPNGADHQWGEAPPM